ncbi:hypothetical protein [Nocardia sp. NPDC051981]|uniref:hypothetical protein n=1 Tax=Nocardia sp. NPDC051981 TaxID=3155417 RepID=UPI0034486DAA
MGLLITVGTRTVRWPAVSTGADDRLALRYNPLLNPHFHTAWLLGTIGGTMVWGAVTAAMPGKFIVGGGVLTVLALATISRVRVTSRTTYLIFDKSTFRLVNRGPRIGFDHEFRWDAIQNLTLERDHHQPDPNTVADRHVQLSTGCPHRAHISDQGHR